MPSINEVKNIIVSSDLNGSITPGNLDTWQYYLWDVMIYQNNKNELAYMANKWVTSFYDKSTTSIRNEGPTSFHLVIEFRE